MSSNAVGTLMRIGIVFTAVITPWLAAVGALYGLVCMVSGTAPSLKHFSLLFAAVVLFRMFFFRNVFR